VQAYGRIDILVSNAVVNPTMEPLVATAGAAMTKILDINVKAGLLLTQEALPHMRRGSSLLFVTSITAYQPAPPLAMYAVSKTALLGVVKALAAELGPQGIRVNGIAPGFVPTKFSQALVQEPGLRARQVWTRSAFCWLFALRYS
jgi:dehydrogenase/reductase SDR family member 4